MLQLECWIINIIPAEGPERDFIKFHNSRNKLKYDLYHYML